MSGACVVSSEGRDLLRERASVRESRAHGPPFPVRSPRAEPVGIADCRSVCFVHRESTMHDVEVRRPSRHIAVVELHGEHDAVTKDRLERLLSDEIAANALVVIDVTHAEFVDSSFLHNVVKADRLARSRGSRFVLQMGTARIVRSAIEISGILHSVQSAGSREEALRSSPLTPQPFSMPLEVQSEV